jgi:hypothetical protein
LSSLYRSSLADTARTVISAKLQVHKLPFPIPPPVFSLTTYLKTGDEKYKFLEDAIFVGSQRFIFTPPNILALEFKLSQVVQGEVKEKEFVVQKQSGELRRAH